MNRRALLLPAVIACLSVSFLFAKPGTVKTTNGLTYEGDIKEETDTIDVTAKGIVTTLDRKEVASVEYAADASEEFYNRLGKLAKDDVQGRLVLARWAFDRGRYDLARQSLESAQQIEPNNREVYDLMQTISQQVALETRKNAKETEEATDENSPKDEKTEEAMGETPTTGEAPTTGPANEEATETAEGNGKFVTAEQINLIRQAELRSSDTQVRIRLEGDVKKQISQEIGQPIAEFSHRRPLDQALAILDYPNDKLHTKVRVLSDPASIAQFRREIQPMVVNGCATSNCHGGPNAGDFQLVPSTDSDAATYTNFYLLSTYAGEIRADQTTAFGGMSQMIDRGDASKSILAKFGMLAEHTDSPHPAVAGFRPIFASPRDSKYERLTKWMSQSLRPVAVNYGFDFKLPGATTRPAGTQPAGTPRSDR